MRWNALATASIALVAVASATQAAPRAVVETEPRAVIELFTSPNCSACPPADALFVKLARNPDLITLVMPVDYWNRPNRKDELAVHAFSERQAAYAEVRNEEMLYTPQAMINGALPADGADASEIGAAIAQTMGVLSVPVKAAPVGNEIVVSVGAAARARASAMITVLPYLASRTVPAYGARITYANLVRDIVRLGSWSGEAIRQAIPRQDYAQYDGIVVLLQAGTAERPGAILGATRISLRANG